eukprot:gene29219-5667_t
MRALGDVRPKALDIRYLTHCRHAETRNPELLKAATGQVQTAFERRNNSSYLRTERQPVETGIDELSPSSKQLDSTAQRRSSTAQLKQLDCTAQRHGSTAGQHRELGGQNQSRNYKNVIHQPEPTASSLLRLTGPLLTGPGGGQVRGLCSATVWPRFCARPVDGTGRVTSGFKVCTRLLVGNLGLESSERGAPHQKSLLQEKPSLCDSTEGDARRLEASDEQGQKTIHSATPGLISASGRRYAFEL